MADFTFPTNIKQIGSIGEGIRVYIEDYACSYLQQYAEAGGYEERLAFLVGRYMVIDGQTVLFISGMVSGRYAAVDKDITVFTEKSWKHARDEIKRYFGGLDIVGFMQSQPGYGTRLNTSYAEYFKKTFTREDQVMFVVDPAEKVNAFYVYDRQQENLIESQGYFIYYDKNRGMHEYMLDNRLVKVRVRPLAEVEEAASPRFGPAKGEKDDNEGASQALSELQSMKSRSAGRRVAGRARLRVPENNRKMMNLLVSLSAVLFIVCFIMGAGLIQNDGRLTSMESQLTQLNTAYRDLLVQAREGRTATVFADQSAEGAEEPVPSTTATAVTAEDSEQLLNELMAAREETGEPPEDGQSSEVVEQEAEPEQEQADVQEPTDESVAFDTDAEPAVQLTYTVQPGDSLSHISRMFYGGPDMVEEIMALNGLDNADTIYFGKVLLLP